MAHFIELHLADDENTPICLNVESIALVSPYNSEGGTHISLCVEKTSGSGYDAKMQSFVVTESYVTIKNLLGL